MISSNLKPHKTELDFYKENNIPLWEIESVGKKDLGIIFKAHDGSYINAEVHGCGCEFWHFKIFCAENQQEITIITGSGCLSDFFQTMKYIATDMIHIEQVKIINKK